MFDFMGDFSVLSEALKEFDMNVESDVIYDEMLSIGKSVGGMINAALDL